MSVTETLARIQEWLARAASDRDTLRRTVFRAMLVVSIAASLHVAFGGQDVFILPSRFPIIRAMLLVWCVLHVPIYLLGRSERHAGLAHMLYVYAAFVILWATAHSLNATVFERISTQIPHAYSLLLAAIVLLPFGSFVLFSTVTCGAVAAWTIAAQAFLVPAYGHGGRAAASMCIQVLGQWILGIVASGVLEGHYRRMLSSQQALARHNERLEEEVAARARVIKQQQHHLAQAQKLEALGRITGTIAHDFSNVLTTIRGYTQLLIQRLRRKKGDEAQYAKHIETASHLAEKLTDQLLSYSRKQATTSERQVQDVNSLIRDMTPMLERTTQDGARLTLTLSGRAANVSVHPGHIEQIVMNLAVNARDAMSDGGMLAIQTDDVELDEAYAGRFLIRPGRYVMISVSDTGCGMDAETQTRIFEPFFTTKGAGKGTGLGLATVYSIIKDYKGHIDVESEPDHGTTFRIYLPLIAELPLSHQQEQKENDKDNQQTAEAAGQ